MKMLKLNTDIRKYLIAYQINRTNTEKKRINLSNFHIKYSNYITSGVDSRGKRKS